MRTARAIVYNEGRTASPSKWREARDYVSTMGEEQGLREYFLRHSHPDYKWFKDRYLGDAGRMAKIIGSRQLGSVKKWA